MTPTGLVEAEDRVLSDSSRQIYPEFAMYDIRCRLGNGLADWQGPGRYKIWIPVNGIMKEFQYANVGGDRYVAIYNETDDEKVDLPEGTLERIIALDDESVIDRFLKNPVLSFEPSN